MIRDILSGSWVGVKCHANGNIGLQICAMTRCQLCRALTLISFFSSWIMGLGFTYRTNSISLCRLLFIFMWPRTYNNLMRLGFSLGDSRSGLLYHHFAKQIIWESLPFHPNLLYSKAFTSHLLNSEKAVAGNYSERRLLQYVQSGLGPKFAEVWGAFLSADVYDLLGMWINLLFHFGTLCSPNMKLNCLLRYNYSYWTDIEETFGSNHAFSWGKPCSLVLLFTGSGLSNSFSPGVTLALWLPSQGQM